MAPTIVAKNQSAIESGAGPPRGWEPCDPSPPRPRSEKRAIVMVSQLRM